MTPELMEAVQVDGDGRLVTRRIAVPQPGHGEVLIRTAAAPINPSDRRFLWSARPFTVPGLEGSGTVVASGGGLLARLLMGRRVAFALPHGGTWAEYSITSAMRCIPLRRSVSLEQGAVLIVNPLTAVAFLHIARRGGHGAIVNNAGASALGRMIIRLGRRSGITTISIVRHQEHVDALKALGADYVLNSADAQFPLTLRDLAHRVRATLAFDAVGGAQTGVLVEAMPFGSTCVVYAGLAGEPSSFDALTLAGEQKTITGFYLPNWMATRGLPGLLRDVGRVQQLVNAELQTTIRDRFPLSAAQRALDMYEADMTAGKVLLVADPQQPNNNIEEKRHE